MNGPILILAVTTIVLSSCATPQPVSRLTPMTKDYKWWYGSQLLSLNNEEGLSFELAFKRSSGQHLIFDFWVKNTSGKPVLISPEDFYYEALRSDTNRLNTPLQYAVNPEKELLDLQKREARAIADRSNAFLMEVTSTTLDIADDIITKDKSPEQKEQERQEREDRREDYTATQEEGEIRLQSLDAQRHYWENNALRKTTLETGFELGGNVFFPREDQAIFLRFHFKVAGKDHTILFRQVLHRP